MPAKASMPSWFSSAPATGAAERPEDQIEVVSRTSQSGAISSTQASKRLSRPVTINTPSTSMTTPRACLPALPAASRRPAGASWPGARRPRGRPGEARRRCQHSHQQVTWTRLLPWLARVIAAPRVGPTQGLQTRPRSRPRTNCPTARRGSPGTAATGRPRQAGGGAGEFFRSRGEEDDAEGHESIAAALQQPPDRGPRNHPRLAMKTPTRVNEGQPPPGA